MNLHKDCGFAFPGRVPAKCNYNRTKAGDKVTLQSYIPTATHFRETARDMTIFASQDSLQIPNRPARSSFERHCFRSLLGVFAIGWVLGSGVIASGEEPAVRHRVSFANAANHYVNVESQFWASAAEQQLFMPVWTPGSYLVREYARHVDSIEAMDAKGDAIAIKKISKNRWQVSNEAGQMVTVRYRLYCNELTVRTNFVDAEFGLLNGAAVFLTSESAAAVEQIVEMKLPANWHQVVTSLERRVQLGPHVFVAENFDALVDSPFVVGNPTLHPFRVGGVEHFLVNQGGDGLWDGEQAAADVAKIVEVHQAMWGQVPYDRYYFLNVIAESGGGLEHDNSTVMLASRWSFRSERRYKSWLGLASHEFFHTWNVRRLRPKALVQYDYELENYFEELWVAEGVTSYYDEMALARAGHITTKDYLAALSKQIDGLQSADGRLKQSLAEASHDAWIKYYRPNENSRNTTISYYTKGAIVAFLLDIEIRRATGSEKSLDDAMRALYAKHALGDGYDTQDVIAEVSVLTGEDHSEWFQRAIYSAEDLDYQPALDWLGLKFSHEALGAGDDVEEEAPSDDSNVNSTVDQDKKGPIWTGLSTKSDGGKLVVSAVAESGPGFAAGINVDDEIIAVNDYRVSGSLSDLLDPFREDETVELLIARRGALSRVALELVSRNVKEWKLEILPTRTEEQEANLAAWLHQVREQPTLAK